MYASLPSDVRDQHPYHMYDEIKSQPDAVAHSLELAAGAGRDVARSLTRARRVFLTGCGTSFHAALTAAWFFRSFTRGKLDARAIEAFDLATYLPGLRPDDVVIGISHSGGTPMTVEALSRGRRSGCETVVVTGFPESEAAKNARLVLPTGYAEERSWAHTVSYTSALTSLAAVANMLAEREERLDLAPLGDVMRAALDVEEIAHRIAAGVLLAERYREGGDIVLVGGGPHAATAREGELKLLETSYVHASAFSLEEMLHGPLAAVTPETLAILVVPSGRTTERAAALIRALRAIGAGSIAIVGEESAAAFEDTHRVVLPEVPETIAPIPFIVPIQFFAYFLAVGKGMNPDLLHRDDERYLAARAAYR